MSLLLDTGNFNALYIDGKVVSKMFFNGEEIYDASKWFAIGNKFNSAGITGLWGNSDKKLCVSTDANASRLYCIGKISAVRNTYCCETNKAYSEFTDLGAIKQLVGAFNYLPISSLSECKNVYYVTRFKQTTYDGDLLIKPFIRLGGSINASTKLLGANVQGIGNKSADNTDEGFSYVCPSSYKGKTVVQKVKLSDEQVEALDLQGGFPAHFPDFLCKAFKTDDSTTATKATAYYGGFLLLEV